MRRAARRSGREGGWRREGEDYSDNLLLSVPGGTPFSPHCIYLWCERKHKWKLLFIMLLLIILLSGLGLNLTMEVLGNSEKDCSESLLAMTCEKNPTGPYSVLFLCIFLGCSFLPTLTSQ